MKHFFVFSICLLLVSSSFSQSFTVGGSSTNYYPVTFSVSGISGYSSLGSINIYRPVVHADGLWYGSFHSKISFISENYGHMGTKLANVEYITGSGGPYNDPIGDIQDGSTTGSGSELIVWLKGGATYLWSATNSSSVVSLSDGNASGTTLVSASGGTLNIITVQTSLISKSKNNSFYASIGIGTDQNGYVGGNLGVGTAVPSYKLDVKTIGSNDNIVRSYTDQAGAYFVAQSEGSDGYYGLRMVSGGTTKWMLGSYGYSDFCISRGDGSTNKYFTVRTDGVVGIGANITPPSGTHNYKLLVDGKIGCKELKVTLSTTPWPDYVFGNNYKLKSLYTVEQFIQQNRHLPNMPSTEEVKKDGGINIGEMNARLLEKVEELTLYMIQLKKENDALKKDNIVIKQSLKTLLNKN